MTLSNLRRGLKLSLLSGAVLCAGNLVLVSGCAEKCDKCSERKAEKAPCGSSCAEKSHAKPADK